MRRWTALLFFSHGFLDRIVSATLMGDALEVVDNMDYGAAKGRFDGEYNSAK